MSEIHLGKAIAAAARDMAGLAPGEHWPTNAELGGSPTGTRDDEYHDAMHEQAASAVRAALPYILDALDAKAMADHTTATDMSGIAAERALWAAEWLGDLADEVRA